MQRIVRWCLKNKSVVILATLLLIGSGAYAATQLNQELLPDISFPIITILTPVAGAGPDLVDEQVTQPVEDAIGGVQGIQSVRSTSSQGFSVVLVEFDLDQDTGEAESDLQSAIDGISLPSQGGEPEVKSQSASQFPILSLSLTAKDGEPRRSHQIRRRRRRSLHRRGRRRVKRGSDRGHGETNQSGSRSQKIEG